eukprot:scaffold13609_cov23-Prasinocladus_malaysianus.AAC.1
MASCGSHPALRAVFPQRGLRSEPTMKNRTFALSGPRHSGARHHSPRPTIVSHLGMAVSKR